MGSAGVSMLAELLRLDPRTRINAMDALEHEFFRADPLPANPADLPRFEDSHELDRRKQRGQKPPAPAGGTVGVGTNPNGDWGARAGELPPYVNGGSRRQPSQAPPNHRAPWAKDGGRPLPPPPPTSQAPIELSTIPPPPRGLPRNHPLIHISRPIVRRLDNRLQYGTTVIGDVIVTVTGEIVTGIGSEIRILNDLRLESGIMIDATGREIIKSERGESGGDRVPANIDLVVSHLILLDEMIHIFLNFGPPAPKKHSYSVVVGKIEDYVS